MKTFTDPAELQARSLSWRAEGLRVGFVPTMGALHEGHLSLVREARRRCDRVVVSIFVNPLQFGPNEDLDAYPRDLEGDSRLLEDAGADALFFPSKETLYPAEHRTRVRVCELTEPLCGRSRPVHFEGVTTVVAMLFQVALPHAAFFGKKDYQQWRVLERMAQDLLMPVEVVGLPTVREPDGLAMSSRNAYLDDEQRARATALSRGLRAAKAEVVGGERDARAVEAAARAVIEPAVDRLDYLEARDAKSLATIDRVERPAVLAVAAFIGKTRLIDNIELG